MHPPVAEVPRPHIRAPRLARTYLWPPSTGHPGESGPSPAPPCLRDVARTSPTPMPRRSRFNPLHDRDPRAAVRANERPPPDHGRNQLVRLMASAPRLPCPRALTSPTTPGSPADPGTPQRQRLCCVSEAMGPGGAAHQPPPTSWGIIGSARQYAILMT